MLPRLLGFLRRALLLLALVGLLGGATFQAREPAEHVRRYTRRLEFDFVGWTLKAAAVKAGQSALGSSGYLEEPDRQALVLEYMDLVRQARDLERQVEAVYGDPEERDPEAAAAPLRAELRRVRARQDSLQPLMEAILQEQVAVTLEDLGLDLAGVPVPPVAFHFTRTPLALIVSPREVIRQDANISLEPGLPLEVQVDLETAVERGLNVSALVVPVGGVGTYPTMIQESDSLVWVSEVVVHEWIHNYLTLRPLGWNYNASQELRTMNETTATILGKVIGREVLLRYYPDLAPPPPSFEPPPPPEPGEPPAFDFRREMHLTRVRVDELLAQGKIEEAEAYMEQRRQFFWEHGYRIRRLNQAYFAFYGSYADQPLGAAGEDPVGAAVRALWKLVGSPTEFLRLMAWMDSFEDLQETLSRLQATR